MKPRIDYIEIPRVESAVHYFSNAVVTGDKDAQENPTQIRLNMLACDCKQLGLTRYAIGHPMDLVTEPLSKAGSAYLKVLELRGTEGSFHTETIRRDKQGNILEHTISPSERDFSVGNSVDAFDWYCLALMLNHEMLAKRIIAKSWEPEKARYISPNSLIGTTPGAVQLSFGAREMSAGNIKEAMEHFQTAKKILRETNRCVQTMLCLSILSNNKVEFIKNLNELLTWHAKNAPLTKNRSIADFYICIPAMGLTALAMKFGLVQKADVQRKNVYFPMKIFS